MRQVLAALAVCMLAMTACADDHKRPLVINSKQVPFSSGQEASDHVGKLHHLGTLRLKSADSDFGGLSGLIVSPDGKSFLAITDNSHWVTGELQYKGKRLAGATGIELAPLRDLKGDPLSGKDGDAEGLTGTLDGDVYVSFERDHRIWRYPFSTQGLDARPVAVTTPKDLQNAPQNGGLEAITLLSDNHLLAITEEYFDAGGNIKAWDLNLKARTVADLTFKRRLPFDITDVRQLPDGDLLTVERRFNKLGGIGFQMRRFPAADLTSGSVIDGEVLADVAMNFNIDNMEGLSVRKGENGETFVYVVSDDNFNAPLQQTLLMLFELKP
jgi:hypothetical protein